ncbi:MAG TPA: site-specific DNA-methyltransferase [Vicinamibacterales bacterium]|nr:site-specific DNA-methyltransferase [Vicinamibacterales bacterium]
MAKRQVSPKGTKKVETLRHPEDKRLSIPTAEHQSVLEAEHLVLKTVRYPRNPDLDPQLVWRGKDYQDWSDLVVQAPPLYIQEKIHPKALIDDLVRESRGAKAQESARQIDLFADFNGMPEGAERTDFYQHEQNWTNRMILGDSLQVMASLAEREGLRGHVHCIYIDPPYGIRFNSNFQWSTTSREVDDGKRAHITREPEQVKAFRDTWRDGIHSYLSYLRDRLSAARDLLASSGSIFVQIGDENLHLVRNLLDEVFGVENFCSCISFAKTVGATSELLPGTLDYVLWYARDRRSVKYRPLLREKEAGAEGASAYTRIQLADYSRRRMTQEERVAQTDLPNGARVFTVGDLTSARVREGRTGYFPIRLHGQDFLPPKREWSTNREGIERIKAANRIERVGNSGLGYVRFLDDFPAVPLTNMWPGTIGQNQFGGDKVYVVQTALVVVRRCILMTTDPGDLVLDPTCGSGTTAFVAEQWGRRWITIDTSRVALALARARIMGARYSYYLLADSPEGLRKEAEVSGRAFIDKPTRGNVRHGFVYERVPHITLKSIANNTEIDVIYEEHQPKVQAALDSLNEALRGHKTPFHVTTGGREGTDVRFDAPPAATFTMPSGEVVPAFALVEWEVPREAPADWPEAARKALADFWEARIARQKAIDASIAAKAEFEYLYDRPYVDPKTVRVAGPFTVETLSPHRMLGVDENDELIDPLEVRETSPEYGQTFEQMILENLRTAGVQQAHKEHRITFTSLTPWPGEMVCAEGRYREAGSDKEKRAAIFIGPEFGTVSRPDLVQAAREAADAGFDVLIACAFNYDAHASEFNKLGRIPVLKARMNADLHMGGELKPTSKGNLFVVFGEPDIDILHRDDGTLRVHVKGVDVFDPTTGEVRSDGADGIACWFIDTDYNEESFFVRHAYFLGQNDPYGALKTTLKAEIDPDVWASLHSDISRPFPRPKSGRIAVKVINHLGDEVMKVFRIE